MRGALMDDWCSRNAAGMLEDFWFCCIDIRFPGHNKGRLERAALFNMR